MIVWVDAGMRLMVNLSERAITSHECKCKFEWGFCMIGYMNISVCMNLLLSLSGSKNMNMCVSVWASVWVWMRVWAWVKYELKKWIWECLSDRMSVILRKSHNVNVSSNETMSKSMTVLE